MSNLFGIEAIGETEVKVFLKSIRVNLKETETLLPEEFAKHAERKIKSTIYKQNFKIPALTPKYLRWKKEHGLSTRILIATGEYVRSITTKRIGKTWLVVVPPISHVDSDLMMNEIAEILEFGSPRKNIPARPVWAITSERLRSEYPKFARDFARTILNKILGVNVGGGSGGKRWLLVEVDRG